jgi:hypothetical protein
MFRFFKSCVVGFDGSRGIGTERLEPTLCKAGVDGSTSSDQEMFMAAARNTWDVVGSAVPRREVLFLVTFIGFLNSSRGIFSLGPVNFEHFPQYSE